MSSVHASSPSRITARLAATARTIDRFQPLFALAIRLYVARVFLLSGLTKIQDWNITLALFENEYRVPLLSPAMAATFGTAAELVLPALLAVGLGTRFAALGSLRVQPRGSRVVPRPERRRPQGSRPLGRAAARHVLPRSRQVVARSPASALTASSGAPR